MASLLLRDLTLNGRGADATATTRDPDIVDRRVLRVYCKETKRSEHEIKARYIAAYIKCAHSKQAAIELALSAFQITDRGNGHIDLRCRILDDARPSTNKESWHVFESNIWDHLVDKMEFLLVGVRTPLRHGVA
ncbi:hypothetical protein CPC08DRAFT_712896 [Agrocybe pediades]|nr:hypothetical protein CPC08DRAFT_712896 [Agrocybe pediades]